MKPFICFACLFMPFSLMAQITTTKITKKNTLICAEPYDSTYNYLGANPFQYVGQTLFLKPKSDALKKYGYEGFSLDYKQPTLHNKGNIYKCCDGFNSKYVDLSSKYFEVLKVYKHPEATENFSYYNNKYYLKLKVKDSNDTVYYEYDSKDKYRFPFITVGFYEKQKRLTVGKKFVFSNSISLDKFDVETGKPITQTLGQVWTCIDLTTTEDEGNLIFILKNALGEKSTIGPEALTGKYSKNRSHLLSDVKIYKAKFGKQNWLKILKGEVEVGFTEEMTLLSWGEPQKINRASYGDQWVYHGQYLYFENGKLKAFN